MLLGTLVLVRSARLTDMLAVAAASALVAALAAGTGSDQALALLLAPLCCAAAGVLTFRAARVVLRGAERVARGGPVLPRLALVNLARSPGVSALAIAFIAVATGLGGFALAYRSTLVRSAADQAADRVPLDVLVSPGPDFNTPLEVRSASALAGARVGRRAARPPDRRELHHGRGDRDGYRARHSRRRTDRDSRLAGERRLGIAGDARPAPRADRPGPGAWTDASGGRADVVAASFLLGFAVTVTADLRDPQGAIRQVTFGTADASAAVLRVPVPRGRWELEALELDEPTGLAITNGHQNGEAPGAATRFRARRARAAVRAGRPRATAARPARRLARGRRGGHGSVGHHGVGHHGVGHHGVGHHGVGHHGVGHHGVGHHGPARQRRRRDSRLLRHRNTGRVPAGAPTDTLPVPVLADPQTAASTGPDGRIALTVDGLPVVARVVGVLGRFPTIEGGEAGFVIADEATLAAALDAQLPGQGRPDELWISTGHLARLRAALDSGTLAQLDSSFRVDLDHQLRDAPVARGVLGTLIAATVLSVVLAVVGLLTALLGGARDERASRDLSEQGVGPRGLRAELRVRLALASVLGVIVGLGIAVLLTRLAVASVRAAGTVADPSPPVVTVVPWAELAAWGAGTLAVLALAGALATRALIGGVVR